MPFSTHTSFSTLFSLLVSLLSLQRRLHICRSGQQVRPNVLTGHVSAAESEKQRPCPPAEAQLLGYWTSFQWVWGLSPLGPSSATGRQGGLNLSSSVSPEWTLEQHETGISLVLSESSSRSPLAPPLVDTSDPPAAPVQGPSLVLLGFKHSMEHG